MIKTKRPWGTIVLLLIGYPCFVQTAVDIDQWSQHDWGMELLAKTKLMQASSPATAQPNQSSSIPSDGGQRLLDRYDALRAILPDLDDMTDEEIFEWRIAVPAGGAFVVPKDLKRWKDTTKIEARIVLMEHMLRVIADDKIPNRQSLY